MSLSPHFLEQARDAARILSVQVKVGRRQLNITRHDLADRAGVSVETVKGVESGDLTVPMGEVLTVALAAGVQLYDETNSHTLKRMRSTLEHMVTLIPSTPQHRKEPGVSTDF